MKFVMLTLLTAFTLVGCAATYKKGGNGKYGYDEIKLGEGLFHVRYVVSKMHKIDDSMRAFWIKRANELCLNNIKETLLYVERGETHDSPSDGVLLASYIFPAVGGNYLNAHILEGVVLCDHSPLNKTDVKDILLEEAYIFE